MRWTLRSWLLRLGIGALIGVLLYAAYLALALRG